MIDRTTHNGEKINWLDAMEYLASTTPSLLEHWNKYLGEAYFAGEVRANYLDVGNLCAFVMHDIKTGNAGYMAEFFARVEFIIENADEEALELIVVGLIEDMQNIASNEDINYHTGFDQWLQPRTKTEWQRVIDFWEKPG